MAGQTDENRLHVLRHAAFTARDVREMERPLLENGVPLMRMASAATAHVVAEMLEDEGVALEESNIVLLAGSGDNGGDGLFAATMLASNGASVTAVAVGRTLHGGIRHLLVKLELGAAQGLTLLVHDGKHLASL